MPAMLNTLIPQFFLMTALYGCFARKEMYEYWLQLTAVVLSYLKNLLLSNIALQMPDILEKLRKWSYMKMLLSLLQNCWTILRLVGMCAQVARGSLGATIIDK